MEFIYRKAEASDAVKIAGLFLEMLKTIYHSDDVKGYEEGYLDKFFSESEDFITVAELEKEVVAFLSIEVYREDGYVYLDDFSVTEKCRGQGVGTKLIGLAEAYCMDTSIPAVVLHVEKTNEKAHRLYKRLGYRDHEDQGNRILMVKDLSPEC